MIFHGGFYFYCESRGGRHLYIRRSRTIAGIGNDAGGRVWTAPERGANGSHLRAPELHLIDGRWFIYYAANDGENANYRMWVLEAEGSDPRGKYHCRGQLDTGGWAVDGTLFTLDDTRKYFVWSGRSGKRDAQQNLYIAPMSDPATISGDRVLLAEPEQKWERVGMPTCEAPQVLRRDSKLFIVYSASGSWTPDCCLGLLHNNTGDVLNSKKWRKHGPVFQKTDQVWGVGHCSFVKSFCQTEDWMVYHAKSSRKSGCEDRDVHAKQFYWSSDGFPDFGEPLPRTNPLRPPSRTRNRPLPLAA
jgi:GH43 family beta-xylosidase